MLSNDRSKNAEQIVSVCKELEQIYINIDDIILKKMLYDRLVDTYLHAFFMGKLHRKKYKNPIDKVFLRNNANVRATKIKSLLYCIHPALYYYLIFFYGKIVKFRKGINSA